MRTDPILTSDQKIINKFLKELVKKVTDRYSQDIDFIILFGSAARDEFKRGISDIDLVIQLKGDQKQREIEDLATRIFWEIFLILPFLFFLIISRITNLAIPS
jgi:predicted nucleotidyltransferase